MAAGKITTYLSKSTPKRKQAPSTSSESDSSPVIKHDTKRSYHDLSGPLQEEDGGDKMAIHESLEEIRKQFDTLARKEDIRKLQSEVDKLFEKLNERMDRLESRCFDIETGMDRVKEEITVMKKENTDLKDQLRRQEHRVAKVLSDQNDLEQYDRRWNLRLFNVQENTGETSDDCAKMCCKIFTEGIGVPVKEEDLEAAHRTGPTVTGRTRTVIVRFQSRKLRDKVLADRKKLKGKKVSVDEDLTAANAKLARDAYKHSFTLASWSSQGKVFAKLKNGKTVRFKYGIDVDDFLKKEM